MSTEPQRNLRVDRQTVRSWLDRLDQRAVSSSRMNFRLSERFAYRPDSGTLELPEGDHAATRHAVACRNISREGLGFLAGQFIYPHTPCKVTLLSPYGREQVVAGRVARCRYVVGSGVLYEVGVAFDHPIDVTVFAPHAKLVRILLAGTAPSAQELVASFLKSWHVDLRCATGEDEVASTVAASHFDLILIDLESPDFDAFQMTRKLRTSGYVEPVVGMTVQAGTELHARCVEAGCTGYISKPIIRDDLHDLVASLMDPPLVSSLAHDASMAPLIDRFVGGLRDKVTEMSLASEAGDLETLEQIARDLRAEAGSYGFEIITEEAAYVEALIAAKESNERIRRALHHLMHSCLKARPATCPPDTAVRPAEPDEVWTRLVTRLPSAGSA